MLRQQVKSADRRRLTTYQPRTQLRLPTCFGDTPPGGQGVGFETTFQTTFAPAPADSGGGDDDEPRIVEIEKEVLV